MAKQDATPEAAIAGDRGILSVNAPQFRSRMFPMIIGVVTAALLLLWLAPGPGTKADANPPGPTRMAERFDESPAPVQLLPARESHQGAANDAAVAPSPAPITVVPAIDPDRLHAGTTNANNDAAREDDNDLLLSHVHRGTATVGVGAPNTHTTFAADLVLDRTFTLSEGTFLDCVLETALSSDVPGMTSCRLTGDVYGDDGQVVLLERSTQLLGAYQSGLEQGKARIQVVWVRARTPNGVTIELDSPGTDALGRAGLAGDLDNHFWQRFGAAVFLSSLDDVTSILSARRSNAAGAGVYPQNSISAAQGAAAIAVGNDVHITPTLIKNQGDHINVFVAHDLDFRRVYRLSRVPSGSP